MKMSGLERLVTALKREKEPDVAPHFEAWIHQKVRDALLPDACYEDFIEHIDL